MVVDRNSHSPPIQYRSLEKLENVEQSIPAKYKSQPPADPLNVSRMEQPLELRTCNVTKRESISTRAERDLSQRLLLKMGYPAATDAGTENALMDE